MRIKVRIVMYASEKTALELFDIVKQKARRKLGDMFHIEVFEDQPECEALVSAIQKKAVHVCSVQKEEVFSEAERMESLMLEIIPNSHNGGYPQPENSPNYLDVSFNWASCPCPNCTIGISQAKPLRLKSSTKLGRNDISGIWWIREAFIVSNALKEKIEEEQLTGVEFWPVIKHGKNEAFEDVFQLKITGTLPPMDPSTNILFKRESDLGIRTCPNGCGMRALKSVPRYRAEDVHHVSDFALSSEWFGSYHAYWRVPFLSQRAYRLFKEWKVKGIRYVPVQIVE